MADDVIPWLHDTAAMFTEIRALRAENARLEADLTAALNIAEASAKECERLRGQLKTAHELLAEFLDAGERVWSESDRKHIFTIHISMDAADEAYAALAPEEPPDAVS